MKTRKYLYLCIDNNTLPFWLKTDNKPYARKNPYTGTEELVIEGRSGNTYLCEGKYTHKDFAAYRKEQIAAFGEFNDLIEEA